jgi:hypothetical protein
MNGEAGRSCAGRRPIDHDDSTVGISEKMRPVQKAAEGLCQDSYRAMHLLRQQLDHDGRRVVGEKQQSSDAEFEKTFLFCVVDAR